MTRCGYRTEDGERFYVPACWGGLYSLSGCYCPRRSKPTWEDLEDRVEVLERRVASLELANPHTGSVG